MLQLVDPVGRSLLSTSKHHVDLLDELHQKTGSACADRVCLTSDNTWARLDEVSRGEGSSWRCLPLSDGAEASLLKLTRGGMGCLAASGMGGLAGSGVGGLAAGVSSAAGFPASAEGLLATTSAGLPASAGGLLAAASPLPCLPASVGAPFTGSCAWAGSAANALTAGWLSTGWPSAGWLPAEWLSVGWLSAGGAGPTPLDGAELAGAGLAGCRAGAGVLDCGWGVRGACTQ